MDFETSLQVLNLLTTALTVPQSLDQGLSHITQMTCTLMDTEQTVLLLRDEEHQELIVRQRVGITSRGIRVGHPLEVPPRLKNILWRVRSLHQINWVEAGIEDIGFPILVIPLKIQGECIGMLITGEGRQDGFDQIQRKLYALVASFASLVIENGKVYDYLKQQFAQRSQELAEAYSHKTEDGSFGTQQLMISSLTDPNKVVRLLAESFYKELDRAGFAPAHITTAAAQILDCITRKKEINW